MDGDILLVEMTSSETLVHSDRALNEILKCHRRSSSALIMKGKVPDDVLSSVLLYSIHLL